MKNNKGITLIALVVTIIILLILAGISIAMLTGDNGILTNASKTSTENAYYQAEEQVKLAFMAVKTEIMAQTVKLGTYSPITDNANLTAIVTKDLGANVTGSKWAVSYTEPKIKITYTDSKIDKEVIGARTLTDTVFNYTAQNGKTRTDTPVNLTGTPKNEGKVYYTITLYNNNIQEATLECDLSSNFNRTYN